MSIQLYALLSVLSNPASLIADTDVQLVRAHCTSCHSDRLITQNSGTREDWKRTIRWMQTEQNLWALDEETEDRILGYLAKHYGPRRAFRRAPLHPSLLPPNPHKPLVGQGATPTSLRIKSEPLAPKHSASDSRPIAPSTSLEGRACACDATHSPTSVWLWVIGLGLLRHRRRSQH